MGKALGNLRMGASCIPHLPLPPLEQGGGVELKLIANGLINIDCNEVPRKTEKDVAWRASRLMNTWAYWESGAL